MNSSGIYIEKVLSKKLTSEQDVGFFFFENFGKGFGTCPLYSKKNKMFNAKVGGV